MVIYNILENAYVKVKTFYAHVAMKYSNTYSIELMDKNIDEAINDMYKIENGLMRRKPTISRWSNYFMANTKKWYYAYTLTKDEQGNDVVTIVDACQSQNMHEQITNQNIIISENDNFFSKRKMLQEIYSLMTRIGAWKPSIEKKMVEKHILKEGWHRVKNIKDEFPIDNGSTMKALATIKSDNGYLCCIINDNGYYGVYEQGNDGVFHPVTEIHPDIKKVLDKL